MDWRVLAAPTQLAAHCFACFTPQIYEQKRDDSQSGFVKMLKVFFGGGGWGGVAIFISKYDNTKTTRQQNCLLCKL